MELNYTIQKYIAKTKMSGKKRVLVEGRDDKSHIKNLLDVVASGHKVRIDTAENIKGDCSVTSRNNRAKIDKIFEQCKGSDSHRNLYYLCDREYQKFEVGEEIYDLMVDHEFEGNLTWTLGHSIENYFFTTEIMCDAYRYLCGSPFKSDAVGLFSNVIDSSMKVVAAMTLAARDMGASSFPAGNIGWTDFSIEDAEVVFDIDKWFDSKPLPISEKFRDGYRKYLSVVESSNSLICSRICRGHTAMILLQRIFSSCIYSVWDSANEKAAIKDAEIFSKLKESSVANALSESWVRYAKDGKALYPSALLESVA